MNRYSFTREGFTLVEAVLALVIGFMITSLTVMALVTLVKGYRDTQEQMRKAGQAQSALTRIVRELFVMTTNTPPVVTSSALTFSNERSLGAGAIPHTLSWAGGTAPILWDDADILVDSVVDFNLGCVYFDTNGVILTESFWTTNSRGLQIALRMQGMTGAVFRTTVFPPAWQL